MNFHATGVSDEIVHDPKMFHFTLDVPIPTNLVYLSARWPGLFKHLLKFLRLKLTFQEIRRTWQPYNQPCFRPEVIKKTKFWLVQTPLPVQGSINKERNSADWDFQVSPRLAWLGPHWFRTGHVLHLISSTACCFTGQDSHFHLRHTENPYIAYEVSCWPGQIFVQHNVLYSFSFHLLIALLLPLLHQDARSNQCTYEATRGRAYTVY